MIVLGIDPGYAIVGFGVLQFERGNYAPLEYGAILTDAEEDFSLRLEKIYDCIEVIAKKWKPQAISVEKLYFNSNQKTAIGVAEARGVILLAAQKNNIPLYEYTPLQVKTAVTGYGRAEKYQVMEMTRRLLHLKKVPRPDDTADALAIAICHAQTSGARMRTTFVKQNRQSQSS